MDVLESYTYLGLRLDSEITMELALKDLMCKVNHRLFRFSKLRRMLNTRSSLLVYRTMIMSLFDYASFTHDGALRTNIDKLDSLQKRGLQICYRGQNLSEAEMYEQSEIVSLTRRRQELLLTYMYKMSARESTLDLREMANNTRSQSKIKFTVHRPRNSGYFKSPMYRGINLWDNLGDWYQKSRDKFVFKKRVKSVLDLSTPTKNPTNIESDEDDDDDDDYYE